MYFSVYSTNAESDGKPNVVVNSKGKKRRPSSKTLSSALKCSDMAFLDFLDRCLDWDPNRRMTPDEALSHPFITGARFIPKSTDFFIRSKNSAPEMRDAGARASVPSTDYQRAKYSSGMPLNHKSSRGTLESADVHSYYATRGLEMSRKQSEQLPSLPRTGIPPLNRKITVSTAYMNDALPPIADPSPPSSSKRMNLASFLTLKRAPKPDVPPQWSSNSELSPRLSSEVFNADCRSNVNGDRV
jgi:serine/threonine protein kinase